MDTVLFDIPEDIYPPGNEANTTESSSKRSADFEANNICASGEERLKKFCFSKETKYILLQAVRLHDAHRAPHGKKEEYLTKLLDSFISNLPMIT